VAGAWAAAALRDRIDMIAVAAHTLVSAAGDGLAATAEAVRANRTALEANRFAEWPLETFVGRVPGLEEDPLPARWREWDCRATRLALRGLQADGFDAAVHAAVARHGAARVGLVLGTSASTIGVSEAAYRAPAADGGFPLPVRSPRLNTPHALAMFCAEVLGIDGPAATVSTACSSSAKAFAQAARWLRLGVADAVLVGGVDALCASVLYGFSALGLVSPEPCRPFDAARRGISVGEAAGFALLVPGPGALQLAGYGEAADAHHMSAPHPQGLGAEAALDAALARAGVAASDIGFASLHGTATPQNDAVEAALAARRFAPGMHAAAGKGLVGHTMGAAGIAAAVWALLALERGLCAGTPGLAEVDPSLGATFAGQLRAAPAQRRVAHAVSHAFGFGGNNVALVFGRGS
jgi:3-oxoacyl-[acyl-carrier-protein] synthase-1